MTRLPRFALLLAVALVFVPFAHAQDDSDADAPPVSLGDFTLSGSSTAGFRFDTIKGYQPQYLEMLNLRNGFRLLDLNVNGEAQETKNPFADSFSLQLSNLGGDPFPSAQFSLSKNKVYDFRADWRQSYYFWNQNDNVILPIASVAAGQSKGLTSNHDWHTVRKFGTVDFTVHATNHLRFRFNYYRPSDEGSTFTTRSPDFFDSPAYWGAYARANAFYLFAPLHDYTNRFTGGIDFSYKNWSFHYTVGYQIFTENISLNNVTSPELSIDPAASSQLEPLVNLSGSQTRNLTTPINEITFVGKPVSKVEWRGGYTYYRYQGPANFVQEFNGTAPNAAGAQSPFSVAESATAMVIEPNNIVWQGLTFHALHWLSFNADYKYSRFTSTTNGTYQSILNGTTSNKGTTSSDWANGLSDFTFSIDIKPSKSLIIQPGVQLMKSDVEWVENAAVDPATTLRTKTVRPGISFGYEPSKKVNVRGDFHTTDNGASYTAITPHTQQTFRLVAQVRPMKNLSISNTSTLSNGKLLAANFINNLHTDSVTANYSLGDRFSIFGMFSYESYYAQGNVNYARGTAPLTDFLRDQEINRVTSGGIEGKPSSRSGIRISGNFDRSSGVGAITGVPAARTPSTYNEPPAYGPVTWPLITGTAYYDLPRAGRLAVDLQRTYYSEQIVTVNNFSANLLTIRWTKGF
jgi:hypothetical protein